LGTIPNNTIILAQSREPSFSFTFSVKQDLFFINQEQSGNRFVGVAARIRFARASNICAAVGSKGKSLSVEIFALVHHPSCGFMVKQLQNPLI
jgi:hypothetical protein